MMYKVLIFTRNSIMYLGINVLVNSYIIKVFIHLLYDNINNENTNLYNNFFFLNDYCLNNSYELLVNIKCYQNFLIFRNLILIAYSIGYLKSISQLKINFEINFLNIFKHITNDDIQNIDDYRIETYNIISYILNKSINIKNLSISNFKYINEFYVEMLIKYISKLRFLRSFEIISDFVLFENDLHFIINSLKYLINLKYLYVMINNAPDIGSYILLVILTKFTNNIQDINIFYCTRNRTVLFKLLILLINKKKSLKNISFDEMNLHLKIIELITILSNKKAVSTLLKCNIIPNNIYKLDRQYKIKPIAKYYKYINLKDCINNIEFNQLIVQKYYNNNYYI